MRYNPGGKLIFVLTLTVLLLILQGCTEKKLYTKDFFAMDTIFSITVPIRERSVILDIEDLVRRLNKLLDANNQESDIFKINSQPGKYVEVDRMIFEILRMAVQIAEDTEGSFDPTVGPIVKLWDMGREVIPGAKDIKKSLPLVNYCFISFDEKKKSIMLQKKGMQLDIGAIAKGFAVKKQLELLQIRKIQSALISAGGNNYALGSNPDGSPWKIAIRHPRESNQILGYIELQNMALDTSGDYERCFIKDGIRYHHILDPKTGYPARGLISVTVITKDPVIADALATALFVMGPEKAVNYAKKANDIEVVMVTDEMEVLVSSGARKIFHPVKGLKIKYI